MRHLYMLFLLFVLGLVAVNSSHSAEADANDPGPRWGHVLIYYPAHDQVLLFGGARERGAYLDDTWIWNGQEWKRQNVSGPSARGFAAVAFHAERKTIILHGGRGNKRTTYSDTWEWNGNSWKIIDSTGPYHADHHQAVYIPKDSAILVFGGWTGDGVSDETWIWKDSWSQLDISGPPARGAFGMTYDESEKRVILHGGLWINGQYADIWEWKNGSWSVLSGPYDHSSIDHLAMIYDSQRNQIVGFGGKNYRRVMQKNTLEITDTLVNVLSSDGPSARHSIGLTYDTKRKVMLLYGGKEYQGEDQVPLGDFWKWDGYTWVPVLED